MERGALAGREPSRAVKLPSLKQEPNQVILALSIIVYISENGVGSAGLLCVPGLVQVDHGRIVVSAETNTVILPGDEGRLGKR
jgi:hypothetical protein